jgi:hypothetical protein
MHPDVLDAEVGALAHGVLGLLGARSDHHGVDTTGVSAISQAPVDGVTPMAALVVPGDAGDGDAGWPGNPTPLP